MSKTLPHLAFTERVYAFPETFSLVLLLRPIYWAEPDVRAAWTPRGFCDAVVVGQFGSLTCGFTQQSDPLPGNVLGGGRCGIRRLVFPVTSAGFATHHSPWYMVSSSCLWEVRVFG